jgi:hypothetical protein
MVQASGSSRRKVSPLPPTCKSVVKRFMTDPEARPLLCLGIEGSANKLGAGIISHSPSASSSKAATTVSVLSNVRHTYITPPGEGFLPSDTARHHREWIVRVIKEAVAKAGVRMEDLDCIAYTKGRQAVTDAAESRSRNGYTITGRSPCGQNAVPTLQYTHSRGQPLRWT